MHDKVLERNFVLKAFKDTLKVIQQEPPSVRRSILRSQTEKQRRRHSYERDQLVAKMQRALDWFETAKLAETTRRRREITPEDEVFLPRDRTFSLFQSALDSYLTELQTKRRLRHRTTRAPAGSFEPTDPGWVSVVWEKLWVRLGRGFARFRSHKKPTDFMFPLEDNCSIALVGLPRDRTFSLFQSALDSYLTELQTKRRLRHRTTRAPAGSFESTDPGWVSVVWEKLWVRLGRGFARFRSHKKPTDFMFPLEDNCSIALVGDWGTGIKRALAVAREIEKHTPHHAIHLGDVYYSGTEEEITERFLANWPKNVGRSWALNSNHEMYSGGHGYFKITLKKFKQPASYFCLRNNNWQLIGLDTGYVDHNLNREQFEWLLHKVNNYNGKTILLSHHQLFSAYESQGENLEARLDMLLDEGKIYAWFWGHEHRCIVYKPYMNSAAWDMVEFLTKHIPNVKRTSP